MRYRSYKNYYAIQVSKARNNFKVKKDKKEKKFWQANEITSDEPYTG